MHRGITRNNGISAKTVLALLISISFFALPTQSFAGLSNPGFETGDLAPWQTIPPADVATVVETEGVGTENTFNTYTDLGITVSPKIGQHMLRLGSPKQISEKQNRGDNIVFQTFSSTEDKLVFAARIFSWEHRGDDMVRISLKNHDRTADISNISVTGENGSALSLDLGPGQPASCDTLPCEFVIDAGKSGDFINTGWVVFELTGLPTDGSNVTLEYALVGGQNEAHATWVYFDNANNPPIAVFEVSTTNIVTGSTIEGNSIKLTDKSYDPDAPADYIASRTWTVEKLGCSDCPVETFEEAGEVVIVSADEGTVEVTLTVTDSHGASDTVQSNSTARDDTPISNIAFENGKVYMDVLNQEVLAGTEIKLLGRFVDPGYDDEHIATWKVGTENLPGSDVSVQEKHIPFLNSGVTIANYSAPASPDTLIGNLLIDDQDGSKEDKDFTLVIVDENFDRREPNDDIDNAVQLNSGWVYLSNLQSRNDIDLFEIRNSEGGPIESGSEILVKLKKLPADFDIVLLTKKPEGDYSASPVSYIGFGRTPVSYIGFGRTPVSYIGFGRTPVSYIGFGRTPVSYIGFGRTPVSYIGFGRTPILEALQGANVVATWLRDPLVEPFNNSALTFDQFPISEQSFEIPDDTDLGERDISLTELGLGNLEDQGLSIMAYSTNRGLEEEQILMRSDYSDQSIYVAIVGNNGAFSPLPYSLQLETSRPMAVTTLVGNACIGSPMVTTGATSAASVIHDAGNNSIFVTQRERYQAIYGNDQWQQLESKLIELANVVGGKIISMASTDYDNWDVNPCDIDAVNGVAKLVREQIQANVTSETEYVVLFGSDNIIPYHRVPDATSISNERTYTVPSLTKPGTPQYASLFTGHNITDDYYVDDNQAIDQQTVVYIPRLSISRMLEKPSEIIANINEFLTNNGQLKFSSSLVTGYDFFTDSSEIIASILDPVTPPVDTLIGPWWTGDHLRCDFFGPYFEEGCSSHDINSINAHFSHYMAQSADGHETSIGDYFLSAEVDLRGNGVPTQSGRLSYSGGCHAGYPVPDGNATQFGDGILIDPNTEFAQSMTKQGGVFIGSTGYGLGGTNSIAGTEKLLAIFTEELLNNPTVGKALVKAKQRYLLGADEVTTYVEKSSIQTTLYGLPMYSVNGGMQQNVSSLGGAVIENLQLTISDNGQIPPINANIKSLETNGGFLLHIDGEHTSTVSRPMQPKLVQELPNGEVPHGILITGGTYTDRSNFDPVYNRPTTEWERNASEISFCQDAFWPSQIAKLNKGGSSLPSTLVVVPGQFRCIEANPTATGIERIYTSLSIEVLRSSSNDHNPPKLPEVDLRETSLGTTSLTFHASDAQSGISRIVVLIVDNGQVTPVDSGQLSGDGPFTLDTGIYIDGQKVVAQVIDGANNVTLWTGKGANVRAIKVDAGEDKVFSTFYPTTFTATIAGFEDLLVDAPHVYYSWDFGDGEFQTGNLAENSQATPIVNVDPQGNATFTVTHPYTINSDTVATLKVTDAEGGIGVDDVVMRACGDAPDLPNNPDGDLVGCGISNNGTEITVTLEVAGFITNEFQYRAKFDIDGGNRNLPPDGKTDITIKWDNDNVTASGGITILDATKSENGKRISITFDLADVRFRGNRLNWNAESQSGIQAAQGVGFADQMPNNDELFGFDLQ